MLHIIIMVLFRHICFVNPTSCTCMGKGFGYMVWGTRSKIVWPVTKQSNKTNFPVEANVALKEKAKAPRHLVTSGPFKKMSKEHFPTKCK